MANREKLYEIERTIVEYFSVRAMSKTDASRIVAENGDPYKVVMKKQKIKVCKLNP